MEWLAHVFLDHETLFIPVLLQTDFPAIKNPL